MSTISLQRMLTITAASGICVLAALGLTGRLSASTVLVLAVFLVMPLALMIARRRQARVRVEALVFDRKA